MMLQCFCLLLFGDWQLPNMSVLPALPLCNPCHLPSRLESAPKGTLVLAGSGASAGKIPVLLSKQPEAKDFMAFRFGGFGLCAELHGEEMDGILASATLGDLGVYEVRGVVEETALVAMVQRSVYRRVTRKTA